MRIKFSFSEFRKSFKVKKREKRGHKQWAYGLYNFKNTITLASLLGI